MMPNDSSEFDNPVFRHEFLRSSDGKDLEEVQEQFMKGNWYVFGTWASMVMQGKDPPIPQAASSPHALFWKGFLEKASKSERDEFLELLIRAQLANTGIRYRPEQEAVTSPGPSCDRWLLEYLNSFSDPKHIEDPKKLIGSRLIYYSHYPEERMVRLTGTCLGEKALPALERFLGVQRRFYMLHTDYSTSPQEIDGLFLDTLRAIINIGMTDVGLADEINTILEAQLADNIEKGKPLMETAFEKRDPSEVEQVQMEEYHDSMGMGPPDQRVVMSTISPSSLFMGEAPRVKSQWIKLALSALKGDITARASFQGPRVDFPGTEWVMSVDDGVSKVQDGRLYYLAHFLLDDHYHLPTLWSVDISSGQTRYMLDLAYRSTNRGIKCDRYSLKVNKDGDPVIFTRLLFEPRSEGTVHKMIVFDKMTGEVKEAQAPALEPDKDAEHIAVLDDGHVLRRGGLLWKQDQKGALVWKKDLPEGCLVVGSKEHVAIMTDTELEISRSGDLGPVLQCKLSELGKAAGHKGAFQRELILHDDGLYLFDNNRTVFAYDMSGNHQWDLTADDNWTHDGRPRTWSDGLSFWSFSSFYVLSKDGKVLHQMTPPERLKDHMVQDKDIFYLTEKALLHQTIGSKEIRTLDSQLITHMAKLIGATKEHLVVRFYKDHYYLACLPSRTWRPGRP